MMIKFKSLRGNFEKDEDRDRLDWLRNKVKEFRDQHSDNWFVKYIVWFNGLDDEKEWRKSNKLRVLVVSAFVVLSILLGSIPSPVFKVILAIILVGLAAWISYRIETEIKLNREILVEEHPLIGELKQLLEEAELVTKGGFGRKIKITSQDDIGQLAATINFLLDNVGNFVKDLDLISEESSGTSRHLEDITYRTSQVMQDVSSTLEELSSTTQNLNSNLEEIAEGAKNVDDLTREGLEKLTHLEDKMGQMITISNKTSSRIKELSESSEKMSSFINVISGIARQTNLLALNAAIEAARAGDAGKGFAVVADEVRKLASSTQIALSDINKLIESFRSETLMTVNLIQESNAEVLDGELTLKETSKMFNVIATHISNMVEVIDKSAEASSQIALGSHEIATSSQVQTSSIAEISGLAEQLSIMSKELKEKLSNSAIAGSKIELDLDAFDKAYKLITKEKKQEIKEEMGLQGKVVIGVIARLEPVKGLHFFIDGIKEVVAKHKDAISIIIGDGSMKIELEARVKQEGLERSVLFLGYREDMPSLLSIMDLVVLTSEKEGVPPKTLMEAMAAAKPIVATDVKGNQQLVINNVNGILVEYNNPHKLAYGIEKFIAQPAIRMVFGNEGRKRIEVLSKDMQ